jgi:hypothetical protein
MALRRLEVMGRSLELVLVVFTWVNARLFLDFMLLLVFWSITYI